MIIKSGDLYVYMEDGCIQELFYTQVDVKDGQRNFTMVTIAGLNEGHYCSHHTEIHVTGKSGQLTVAGKIIEIKKASNADLKQIFKNWTKDPYRTLSRWYLDIWTAIYAINLYEKERLRKVTGPYKK
jgi:hypothetical protein